MSTSEIINLILAIVTAVLALTSIIIVIISINQNNKILENSSRPHINVYATTTYYKDKQYYLVIRNYGKSAGRNISITSDTDLSIFAIESFDSPFSFINGLTLSPNQSYSIILNTEVCKNFKEDKFTITVTYEGTNKKYSESFVINMKYLRMNVVNKWESKHDISGSAEVISATLQDIANRNL